MKEIDEEKSLRATKISQALYWLLALLVLAAGVYHRFHLPQVPIMDKDSGSFLFPALSLYEQGKLQLVQGRSYPYPLMLFFALRIFGTYQAIAIFQHLAGVCTGLFAILAWNNAYRLLRRPALPELVYRLMGLIPAWLLLVASKNIIYEHLIRPEAVMPFFIMLSIFLAVQFLRARFVDARPWAACVYGTLMLFCSAFVFVMKAIWGINVIFTALLVLVSAILPDQLPASGFLARWSVRIQRAIPLLAAGLLAVLLLFWPDRILRNRDETGKMFLPTSLFSIHADLILAQLDQDMASNSTPYPTPLLDTVQKHVRSHLHGPGADKMGSLDFNADHLLHHSSLFEDLSKEFGGDDPLRAFCFYYYQRTFLEQPGAMLRKILNSMKVFYTLENPAYESEKKSTNLAGRYQQTLALSSEHAETCPSAACKEYREACTQLAHSEVYAKVPSIGRFAYQNLRTGYLPGLIGALGLAFLMVFFKHLRSTLGLMTALSLLLFSYNFGMCLGVSVVHTLGIRRYFHSQHSFTVFAQFLAWALLLEAAAQLARKWIKPAQDEAPPSNNKGKDLSVCDAGLPEA